jgi:general secretion pathway protein D
MSRHLQRILMVSALVILNGCAVTMDLRQAQQLNAAGDAVQAIKLLQETLKQNPDSTSVKASLLALRADVAPKLYAKGLQLIESGDLEQARSLAQQARQIDLFSDRPAQLEQAIFQAQRNADLLNEAQKELDQNEIAAARKLVSQVLQDSPNNSRATTLRQMIEAKSALNSQTLSGIPYLKPSPLMSLEFKDADLRTLLATITRSSGVNFVLDKDVRPEIRTTLFLRDVSIEAALEFLTTSNQLSYKTLDVATILIYPNTVEKNREYQDLVVKAFYLAYADAKQTAAMLRTVLKIREPFIDEKLNLLVLRESPQILEVVDKLVALQDLSEPEALIQVEVLEVKRSRLTELGIQFPNSLQLVPIPQSGAGGFTLDTIRNLNRSSIGVAINGIGIRARRETGDLNLLANPSIRAKNKERAKFLIGDKVPVVSTVTSSGGNITENISFIDVGLKVEIEPLISVSNQVTLKVGLEVSSIAKEIKTSTGGIAYQIGARTASTTLSLNDGETQVLAGLISKEERNSANRLPGLGDLPFLGRLFSNNTDDNQETELVFAITPRIVKNVSRPANDKGMFWSGSEARVRSSPLTLTNSAKAQEQVTNRPVQPPQGATLESGPIARTSGVPTLVESPVTVKLDAPNKIRVGQKLTVNILIDSKIDLRGLVSILKFDPTIFDLVDVKEEAFFKSNGNSTSLIRPASVQAGQLTAGIVRSSGQGQRGERRVLAVELRAKLVGESKIELVGANLLGGETGSKAILAPGLDIEVVQ